VQGASVPVTLTGTNFAAGATVGVSGSGITVSGIMVVNATQITATFAIAANAAATSYNVTVTSGGQTSNSRTFTVSVPPPPTLTAPLSPNQGNLGQTLTVAFLGTNFISGATSINFVTGTGVTANVNVANSTTMTATIAIAANASLGWRQLTVTTPGGTSGVRWFQVFGLPGITSITPAAGARSSAVTETLNGSNFSSDSVVHFSGTGITVSSQSITNEGQVLTATFTIAANAPTGAQSVTVANSVGTSNAVGFTVQ
jgi:hypothetical protein